MIIPINARDINVLKRLTIRANICLTILFEPVAIESSLLNTIQEVIVLITKNLFLH